MCLPVLGRTQIQSFPKVLNEAKKHFWKKSSHFITQKRRILCWVKSTKEVAKMITKNKLLTKQGKEKLSFSTIKSGPDIPEIYVFLLIIIRTIDRTLGLKTILIDCFVPSYTYVTFLKLFQLRWTLHKVPSFFKHQPLQVSRKLGGLFLLLFKILKVNMPKTVYKEEKHLWYPCLRFAFDILCLGILIFSKKIKSAVLNAHSKCAESSSFCIWDVAGAALITP